MNYFVVMFNGEPVAVSTTGKRDAENALEKYSHERYTRYYNGVECPLRYERWVDQFIAKIVPVESENLL